MNSLYPIIASIVVLATLISVSVACKLMFMKAQKPTKPTKKRHAAVVNTKLMR